MIECDSELLCVQLTFVFGEIIYIYFFLMIKKTTSEAERSLIAGIVCGLNADTKSFVDACMVA